MNQFRSLQGSCLAILGRWSKPGTRSWLVERELRYGGYVTDLKRYRISELDGRTLKRIDPGMTGGDRMSPRRHDYGRIIGLDIDLTHFESNLGRLSRLGAFKAQNHEAHLFDGFVDNSRHLADILHETTVDIVIDDASHADKSILATFESFRQRLATNFVYFIEDNREVHRALRQRYPLYRVVSHDEMTIVTNFDPSAASDRQQRPA